jgi:hypothetical protein
LYNTSLSYNTFDDPVEDLDPLFIFGISLV